MAIQWDEELWHALVETAPDALVMIDREGTIAFVSSQCERLFDYSKEQLLGQKIECLLPERFRAKHSNQRTGYFDLPRARPMGAGVELFALHRDGREIPVEISLSPLKTKNGLLVTAAIRDITESKRIQEDLRSAREAAEAANRSKSAFLANMSHEIRTPLAGILGYAEMIALYCHSDDERKTYIEKLSRCADNLTELINDILDLSKVEAGALNVEAVPVSLVSDVEILVNLLQGRANEKTISLEVIYERPLPAVILSDSTRLRQILANIIGNAIKFTDKGGVKIRIYVENEKKKICFEVTDTGCGLSEEERSRLFQPFVQADSSTTRKFGGTGLGLALSRGLALALGGDLDCASSTIGHGSTFKLSLNLKIPEVPTAVNFPIGGRKSGFLRDRICPRLDQVRILIADDNEDNLEMLNRFLKEQGAITELARNGTQAYGMAVTSVYDVVLMDVQMPEIDGYEVTRRLRKAGVKSTIIALTAHAMHDEREKGLTAGCDEFLTKPFDVSFLIETVFKRTRVAK